MECVDLMDGDGTFRHFPYDGARRNQPWYDMDVLNTIRREWCTLKNAEQSAKLGVGRGTP